MGCRKYWNAECDKEKVKEEKIQKGQHFFNELHFSNDVVFTEVDLVVNIHLALNFYSYLKFACCFSLIAPL